MTRISKLLGAALAGATLLLAMPAGGAYALEGDALIQVLDDLDSQAADKRRLDKLGAVKLELDRFKSLSSEARDAVREEKKRDVIDQYLTLLRAELKLIQTRIDLSLVQSKLAEHRTKLQETEQTVAARQAELKDRTARLDAYRVKSADASDSAEKSDS